MEEALELNEDENLENVVQELKKEHESELQVIVISNDSHNTRIKNAIKEQAERNKFPPLHIVKVFEFFLKIFLILYNNIKVGEMDSNGDKRTKHALLFIKSNQLESDVTDSKALLLRREILAKELFHWLKEHSYLSRAIRTAFLVEYKASTLEEVYLLIEKKYPNDFVFRIQAYPKSLLETFQENAPSSISMNVLQTFTY